MCPHAFDPFINVRNVPDHSAVSSRQGLTQSDRRMKASDALPDSRANILTFRRSPLTIPNQTRAVTYRDCMAHLGLALHSLNSLHFIVS